MNGKFHQVDAKTVFWFQSFLRRAKRGALFAARAKRCYYNLARCIGLATRNDSAIMTDKRVEKRGGHRHGACFLPQKALDPV